MLVGLSCCSNISLASLKTLKERFSLISSSLMLLTMVNLNPSTIAHQGATVRVCIFKELNFRGLNRRDNFEALYFRGILDGFYVSAI